MKRKWLSQMLQRATLAAALVSGLQCTDDGVESTPPDGPTVGSLFAINDNARVTLGWTEWVGGAPFEVELHRGATADFTPGPSTYYATVPPDSNRFADDLVANGSLYYYCLVPVVIGENGQRYSGTPSNVAIGRPSDYTQIAQISYDDHIQAIFSSSCAVHECHVGPDDTSPDRGIVPKVAHGGQFSLVSWEDLIYGPKDGSVLVPFKAAKSDLVFHVNSDTTIAPLASPHMPLPGFSLPAAQVTTLMRWIDEGARNNAGDIPFPVSPLGRIIAACGSEDLLAVVDVETNFLIRYVEVGRAAIPGALFGSPHHVKLDPQGEYFYVTLINSQQLWKMSASTYELVGMVNIPFQPADLALSPDGATAYVTCFGSTQGLITVVDTDAMLVSASILVPFASNPHGIVMSHDATRAFVTNAGSGNVTMINTADNSTSLMALDTLGNPFNSDASPYLADLTPDDRYLLVTDYAAGATNVYVFDLQMDTTKPSHVIPVGGRTVHVAVTPDGQAAFACDLETNSVHVIAIPAFTVQTIPNVGKQPHGVTFTPDGGRAYVTTENLLSPDPPHHPTTEGTGVSYVYIIDVASLTVLGSIEVSAWSQGIAFMP